MNLAPNSLEKIDLSLTIFEDDVSEPLEGGASRHEGVEGLFGGELEVLERELILEL